MSFSADAKAEILSHGEATEHCIAASLCAIMNICGDFGIEEDGSTPYLVISSENERVVALTESLLKGLEVKDYELTQLDRLSAIIVMGQGARLVIDKTALNRSPSLVEEEPVSPSVIRRDCCKRAYLKAAFVCCGSVNDPEKNYHLEFVNGDYNHAQALRSIAADFGIDARIVERKNHYVLYLKEGEQIVDMLNLLSAHKALMEYENSRILKEVRNNVNRIVNCETANLSKVVNASERQREAIEFIKNKVGLDYLPPQLKAVARARLENPSVSLKELGEIVDPPIGKSGVNHRLKKICEIEKQLKGEL